MLPWKTALNYLKMRDIMTHERNKTMMLSLFILSVLILLVEGRLNSEFAKSGPTDVSKAESTGQDDHFNPQSDNGDTPRKETTLICGLVNEKRRYGQGVDLQVVQKKVKSCRIIVAPSLPSASLEQRGMSCNGPQMCVADRSSVEELVLLDAHRKVTSALRCRCLDPRRSCYRETNIRVFHWGTSYEKAVDVGRCIGSCNKGTKTCQAIDTKIVNVKGPNGAHCVQKVLKCGCVRNCYRASFHQLYTATIFDEVTKTNKTLEQVADIGRCVGKCSERNKGRCLHKVDNPLWRPGTDLPPKVCMLSKPDGKTEGKCRPRSFKSRVLFASEGAPKVVSVIKHCKCN